MNEGYEWSDVVVVGVEGQTKTPLLKCSVKVVVDADTCKSSLDRCGKCACFSM